MHGFKLWVRLMGVLRTAINHLLYEIFYKKLKKLLKKLFNELGNKLYFFSIKNLLKWFINERFKTEGPYLYSEKASAFDCRTMHYMRHRLEGLSCS